MDSMQASVGSHVLVGAGLLWNCHVTQNIGHNSLVMLIIHFILHVLWLETGFHFLMP
jgi:hypothetical protein